MINYEHIKTMDIYKGVTCIVPHQVEESLISYTWESRPYIRVLHALRIVLRPAHLMNSHILERIGLFN